MGTCWAFSAVGAVESQRALNGHGLNWLSVEQVTDCDNTTDPTSLNSDCGVFGEEIVSVLIMLDLGVGKKRGCFENSKRNRQ